MILHTEVPVSMYIDIWKWIICLWILVVQEPNQFGFDKHETYVKQALCISRPEVGLIKPLWHVNFPIRAISAFVEVSFKSIVINSIHKLQAYLQINCDDYENAS